MVSNIELIGWVVFVVVLVFVAFFSGRATTTKKIKKLEKQNEEFFKQFRIRHWWRVKNAVGLILDLWFGGGKDLERMEIEEIFMKQHDHDYFCDPGHLKGLLLQSSQKHATEQRNRDEIDLLVDVLNSQPDHNHSPRQMIDHDKKGEDAYNKIKRICKKES